MRSTFLGRTSPTAALRKSYEGLKLVVEAIWSKQVEISSRASIRVFLGAWLLLLHRAHVRNLRSPRISSRVATDDAYTPNRGEGRLLDLLVRISQISGACCLGVWTISAISPTLRDPLVGHLVH